MTIPFFLLSLSLSVKAGPVDIGVPIANETQKLEHLLSEEKLEPAARKRLAEIYFLTSRCLEAHDLLFLTPELQPDVYAACGNFNEKTPSSILDSSIGKITRLKTELEGIKEIDSKEIMELWNAVKAMPEGKYAMLKGLRSRMQKDFTPDKNLTAQMSEWDKSLQALEIK